MSGPQAHWLPDGRRLHLNHGPIDLVIGADGSQDERLAAFSQAVARFDTILDELVRELGELRLPAGPMPRAFAGPTARRMEAAVTPLSQVFLTPMAAVAGAVADEMLAALLSGRCLSRAYVNNGGDIAVHVDDDARLSVAIAGTGLDAGLSIGAGDPVRGIATSGWRGRSHSLGIADAVTVLAGCAAGADAAATLIANAVDLPGDARVTRCPARELAPDSDLCDRLVTVDVGRLDQAAVGRALDDGLRVAQGMCAAGHIRAAALFLDGEWRGCGPLDVLVFAHDMRAA